MDNVGIKEVSRSVHRLPLNPRSAASRLIHSEVASWSVLGGVLHRVTHRSSRGAHAVILISTTVQRSREENAVPVPRNSRSGYKSPLARDDGFLREMDGAEAQSRTGDTGLFRAVLYRLSYLGTVAGTTGFEPAISGVTIQRLRPDWTTSPYSESSGGQDRTRTCDLPDVSRMLSQLSYSPIIASTSRFARCRLASPRGFEPLSPG